MKKAFIILSLLLALVLLASCSSGQKLESEQKTGRFFNLDAEYITGVSLYDFGFGYRKECGNDQQDYIKWISAKLNSLEYSEKEVLSKDEVGVINDGGGPRWQVYVASMYPKGDGQYESKIASCYFTANTIVVEHTGGEQTIYTLTEDSINTLQEILSVLNDTPDNT